MNKFKDVFLENINKDLSNEDFYILGIIFNKTGENPVSLFGNRTNIDIELFKKEEKEEFFMYNFNGMPNHLVRRKMNRLKQFKDVPDDVYIWSELVWGGLDYFKNIPDELLIGDEVRISYINKQFDAGLLMKII